MADRDPTSARRMSPAESRRASETGRRQNSPRGGREGGRAAASAAASAAVTPVGGSAGSPPARQRRPSPHGEPVSQQARTTTPRRVAPAGSGSRSPSARRSHHGRGGRGGSSGHGGHGGGHSSSSAGGSEQDTEAMREMMALLDISVPMTRQRDLERMTILYRDRDICRRVLSRRISVFMDAGMNFTAAIVASLQRVLVARAEPEQNQSEDEVVSRRRADGTGQPFDEWEYLMSEDTFERLRDETFLQ